MLADKPNITQSGTIDRDIQLPCTGKLELVAFIAKQLPRWRDHADRPTAHAETTLTEHLCNFLNMAAHHSPVWSHVQFQTETADEARGGRKIDLTVKPCSTAIIVEGRRHTMFDSLFPIECKRLPTPKGRDRDEREYVIVESGTTGGIQRFKLGYHGATHTFAVMIAYVQEHTHSHWLTQVNSWIQELSIEPDSTWAKDDMLKLLSDDSTHGVCILNSKHSRSSGLGVCELRHLWITMAV